MSIARRNQRLQVFDRFFRPDQTRSRISKESGLGLAIVMQSVEACKDMVKAESPIQQSANNQLPGTLNIFTLTSYSTTST
jgi:signal transduction histidine kinase